MCSRALLTATVVGSARCGSSTTVDSEGHDEGSAGIMNVPTMPWILYRYVSLSEHSPPLIFMSCVWCLLQTWVLDLSPCLNVIVYLKMTQLFMYE